MEELKSLMPDKSSGGRSITTIPTTDIDDGLMSEGNCIKDISDMLPIKTMTEFESFNKKIKEEEGYDKKVVSLYFP
jgi:hypothetical protein